MLQNLLEKLLLVPFLHRHLTNENEKITLLKLPINSVRLGLKLYLLTHKTGQLKHYCSLLLDCKHFAKSSCIRFISVVWLLQVFVMFCDIRVQHKQFSKPFQSTISLWSRIYIVKFFTERLFTIVNYISVALLCVFNVLCMLVAN